MKRTLFLSFLLCMSICMISLNGLIAQADHPISPAFFPKNCNSPLFGYDININDQPDQNQKNIAICSAYNGWLYAIHSYFDVSANEDAVSLLRSEDNGETWAIILQYPLGVADVTIDRLQIIAVGQQNISNITIIVGLLVSNALGETAISVVCYDRNGGILGEIFSHDPYSGDICNFALASDDQNPALNSDPFSLGLLYSKRGYTKDSLIFISTSSGFYPFNKRQKISTSSRYLDQVALSYGYCPAFNSGRYFAAWEEKDNADDATGRIYTSHTEPYFNSAFTTPVRLDNIEPANANLTSSPVIACQNSSFNNDSANLSEIVLFETYIPSSNRHTVSGVYNKNAVGSTSFLPFNIDESENNILQPDLCFNPFDSTFIVTYFDSTAQKLPYYTHNVNMNNPDSWNCITSGYNDLNGLLNPHPQVAMDFGTHTGMNAWIGTRGNGNGEALFDAPFIYYTGEKGRDILPGNLNARIFPNPALEDMELEIDLPEHGEVEVQVSGMGGKTIAQYSFHDCAAGKNRFRIDLDGYDPGVYFVNIRFKDCGTCLKMVKFP